MTAIVGQVALESPYIGTISYLRNLLNLSQVLNLFDNNIHLLLKYVIWIRFKGG
ncbi:hypothetical protein EMIT07CA2_120027 [Brevibacillus sp. IT-7CA2]